MRKGEDDSLLGEEEDLSAFKGSQRIAHITAAETHRNMQPIHTGQKDDCG